MPRTRRRRPAPRLAQRTAPSGRVGPAARIRSPTGRPRLARALHGLENRQDRPGESVVSVGRPAPAHRAIRGWTASSIAKAKARPSPITLTMGQPTTASLICPVLLLVMNCTPYPWAAPLAKQGRTAPRWPLHPSRPGAALRTAPTAAGRMTSPFRRQGRPAAAGSGPRAEPPLQAAHGHEDDVMSGHRSNNVRVPRAA